MDIEQQVQLHFIVNNYLRFKKIVCHVPRVGDEVRFENDTFYIVTKVVWVYDEPEQPWGRANVGLEPVES